MVTSVLEVLAVLLVASGVGVVVAAVVPGAVGVGAGLLAAGVLLLLASWVITRAGGDG